MEYIKNKDMILYYPKIKNNCVVDNKMKNILKNYF